MENIQIHTAEFESSGERLNHILDQIGFKSGRGRVTDFQNFLIEASPEYFGDLKYGTVKSWFQNATPTMRRIDQIIQALQETYSFQNDVSLIKTWWKVGGYYPFVDLSPCSTESQIGPYSVENEEDEEKLQFIAMSLVIDETGDLFKSLSSKDLVRLKDIAVKFAKDFADPVKTDCPREYLRMAIKSELEILKAK